MIRVRHGDKLWAFDGAELTVTYDGPMMDNPLLIEPLRIPLAAIAELGFQERRQTGLRSWLPGGVVGMLEVRPRSGADPWKQVAGDLLDQDTDPYHLDVTSAEENAAWELHTQVQAALAHHPPAHTPVTEYLVSSPTLPLRMEFDWIQVWFDGEYLTVMHTGHRWDYPLDQVERVEWSPRPQGYDDLLLDGPPGLLRVRLIGDPDPLPAQDDINVLHLRGHIAADLEGLRLAAAMTAALPHPLANPGPLAVAVDDSPDAMAANDASDVDGLVLRLRELDQLHRDGALTDTEFADAKQAIIAQLRPRE